MKNESNSTNDLRGHQKCHRFLQNWAQNNWLELIQHWYGMRWLLIIYRQISKLNIIVESLHPLEANFIKNANFISRGFSGFFGHNFDPHSLQWFLWRNSWSISLLFLAQLELVAENQRLLNTSVSKMFACRSWDCLNPRWGLT